MNLLLYYANICRSIRNRGLLRQAAFHGGSDRRLRSDAGVPHKELQARQVQHQRASVRGRQRTSHTSVLLCVLPECVQSKGTQRQG